MRYLRLLAHLAGLSAFAVALQIDDAGAATRRKRVRVKDLNVTKSESPNGPVLQNLPDPMRRNMEPSGNIRRAPTPNEKQDHRAPLHASRKLFQKHRNLRWEGDDIPADSPAQDNAARVQRRL
jgi:hypothetical protein